MISKWKPPLLILRHPTRMSSYARVTIDVMKDY